MEITFFKSQSELRKWFLKNHDKLSEVLIGLSKKNSGIKGVTYLQAVEEALCFGWIDGKGKRIDDKCYAVRFTPRRKGSIWSAVNIAKINGLIKNGKIHSSGLKTYNERDLKKQKKYSYENKPEKLADDLEEKFRRNKKAWDNFNKQTLSYRKTVIFWVMSAVKEETRLRRLKELIEVSAKGEKPSVYTLKPKSEM